MNTSTDPKAVIPNAARFTGWMGVAFVAAFIAGFVLIGQVPGYADTDAAWRDWVNDSATRVPTVIGTMLMSAAGLLLMSFTAGLATHIDGRAPGAGSHLVNVLRGAGVMAGSAMLIGALAAGAMPAAVTFVPDFEAPSADVIKALDQVGISFLLIGFGWSLAVVAASASRVAAQTATLPRWLTSAGLVVAALLLLSFMFLPMVLAPLWVLTTSVVLLRGR